MKSFLYSLLIFALCACATTNKTATKTSGPTTDLTGLNSYNENIQRIANAKQTLAKILAVQGARTIENTLVPYNQLLLDLDAAYSNSGLFGNVHPSEEVRNKALEQEQEIDKFSTELSLNVELFSALKAVDIKGADSETKFFVEKTLRNFRRSGVDKDAAPRLKIGKLQEELSKIGQDFDKNIREDVRYVEVPPADLAGLPQDFIDSHKPQANGLVKISTNYPDLFPVLDYADNQDLKRKLYIANRNRAFPKNKEVLKNLMLKRYELARTLGYKNWAQYATEDKMMKSNIAAKDFINKINELAKKRGKADYTDLLAEKRKVHKDAKEVFAWENSYWSRKVKSSKYQLDPQEARKYFEFKRVKNGIFAVTQQLFGVTYKQVTNVKLWHEDVEAWDIFDGEKQIGRFYLDLFPRDNKYKHAAQFGFRTGITDFQLPQAVLVTNFPNPRENKGPALMEHEEVKTFLHEFGHLLHTIFAGNHKWESLSGIKTEWDFVEVPSQMLEEWIWDAKTVQTFATHFETNQPIPNELVDKMKAAKDFGVGIFVKHQMSYASLSLGLYDQDPKKVNIDQLEVSTQNKYSAFRHIDDTHFAYSFGHLNGYSAIYYTYMWSMVIAKDLFSEFQKNGLFNRETADRYRNRVLAKGGSNYAAELVKDFLGRPFGYDAFKSWVY